MRFILTLLFSLLLVSQSLLAQFDKPLTYYLPDIAYDPDIPTPESFFGFQIGDWHLSHDQQYSYMRALAEASSRITLVEHARSYEHRPLIHLIITSETNQARLEDIRQAHLDYADPEAGNAPPETEQKVVVYQGYSIHGNEPSGGNAAPLVAYYLAAGQDAEVERLLDELVIIFDPVFNPDGFQRFSTWANMHKNQNMTANSDDREYDESWPGGRTNHYWFDLNRDWLLQQHPESRGRVETFHRWKPHILTDHHEMGSNSTFFFMPGEPQRTHPVTPWRNQELTGAIGEYHAEALNEIGSLYYSQEGYDDFYYGKGSTYPDANGCIGILFEQASSRGHMQDTDNGLLTFPFTIRNQVTTALSTYRAAVGLRAELLAYQRNFYRNGLEEARDFSVGAYVFGEADDPSRLRAFMEVLRRHQLEVYELGNRVEAGGTAYDPDHSYVVPLAQKQYRTVRAIFDTLTVFEDSLFYDVSSWTLPHAFNIPYNALGSNVFRTQLLGDLYRPEEVPFEAPDRSDYAYLMRWEDYFAPRALSHFHKRGLVAKVATRPFTLEGAQYRPGTVMVAVQQQEMDAAAVHQAMEEISRETGVSVTAVNTGLTPEGIDLGSRDFERLRAPEVALVVGEGVSSYEAGEAWHLLDQRYDVVVTKVPTSEIGRSDLSAFHTLIMVNGSYSGLSDGDSEKIRDWVSGGGTLIATKNAVRWVNRNRLGYAGIRSLDEEDEESGRRPYGTLSPDRGAYVIGGAIFETELDLSHPLAFGFTRERLPVFRNSDLILEEPKNAYAAPLMYTDTPLLSGYIHEDRLEKLGGSAAIVVTGTGGGKVICMADNPNFRAFWYGTNKLFANAVFFGNIISNAARESRPPEETR